MKKIKMKHRMQSIKPYISLMLVVSSLLVIVFCKMEIRRLGYVLWKESKIEKEIKDELRLQSLDYATLNRPERIERLAKQMWSLERPREKQIVQLNIGMTAN